MSTSLVEVKGISFDNREGLIFSLLGPQKIALYKDLTASKNLIF